MITSFPQIVKLILKQLCPHDYPILNSRLFFEIWLTLQLKRNNPATAQMLFPLDSTVITLTSQLFWMQGYHTVKLINGVNLEPKNTSECLIHFGQSHDARFAEFIPGMIPEGGIGIMDRGECELGIP